jgi:acetyl esterase
MKIVEFSLKLLIITIFIIGCQKLAEKNDLPVFSNPIITADFSDPDVIRVGNDYFMTASSFYDATGLPVLYSSDLVNWQIIGHALKRIPGVAIVNAYQGPTVYSDFNSEMIDESFHQLFPNVRKKEVIHRNVAPTSYKPLRVSDNPFLFSDVTVISEDSFAPDSMVSYKSVGDATLNLHVFLPSGHSVTDKRPAILFFHGGGWNGGAPEQFYPHSKHLASKGMIAISVDYRLRNIHGTTPREAVMDGKSAMRWVRQHAAGWGIDPERIAAGGGSAGGHIAAAAATLKGMDDEGDDLNVQARPDALVLFNPVYDNGPNGYGHDRVADYWKEFSPMHNIDPTVPPTIVFLGTEDRLIPVATAESFQNKMLDLGIRSELILYEGMGHGFFNYRSDRTYFNATVTEMDRFLTSLGFF